MNKKSKWISLLLLLTLNFSCAEKKSTDTEANKLEQGSASATDTLKFTSGIRAIFQDSKGNYWFGSHEEGVGRFDGKSFEYFSAFEGLSDNQIRSIQEDNNGTIWFGTANGVCSFDGKTIKNHTALADETSPSNWMKTENDLWFNAGVKQGVYRYDGQKLYYLEFPISKVTTTGNTYALTSFSKGKNNMLWFGTFAGVFGYNGNQFTIINDEELRLTEESEKLHVRSIFEDSQGRLWIGNNGIGVLIKEHNKTTNFSEINGLIHQNSSKNGSLSPAGTMEHVFAIAEDAEGNIWFGDRDTGAWKYDGKTVTNYAIGNNPSKPMIWTIYKDNSDNLLFGMAEGGVYKFNGNSFDRQF